MTSKLKYIDFYQQAGDDVPQLAAQLADKCVSSGKKLVIYCAEEQASAISRALWVLQDQSFLAHGIDHQDGAEFADIWISTDVSLNPIDAEYAMPLSGLTLPDMSQFERHFILFNGKDDIALSNAREKWKDFAQDYKGHCRYFAKSEEGRWEPKASA